jgi:hypothetical protein
MLARSGVCGWVFSVKVKTTVLYQQVTLQVDKLRQPHVVRQLGQEPNQTYGSNTTKYCLLGNPLNALVVCSRVFFMRNFG